MASALLRRVPEDHVQQRIPHDGPGARPVLLGICLVAGLGAAACNETVGGNKPVGKEVDSDAQIERFLRRAYLDLSGHVPGDGDLTGATTRLRDAGNTAAARGELVDDLIAQDGFATAWFEEFENAVFGGASLEQQYDLICGLTR